MIIIILWSLLAIIVYAVIGIAYYVVLEQKEDDPGYEFQKEAKIDAYIWLLILIWWPHKYMYNLILTKFGEATLKHKKL